MAALPKKGAAEETAILKILNDVNSHIACIQQQTDSLRTATTATSDLMGERMAVEQAIRDRTKDIEVAKLRAQQIREPGTVRSYYDSWFPLRRPLKSATIPALIFCAIFMFVLATLMLLSFAGIETRFLIPVLAMDPVQPWYKRGFFGLAIISVVLLALVIYAFTR